MYQVIARKYRPQTFSELIGQEHVRTTIENAISQRRIAHGYIFSGQRGTGKTTVARILARCLNCIDGPTARPCGECASCREVSAGNSVDVIEIDAASNRGINEMRELRENVRYRPARDRYKIFIVDEAHQITSEAFNALLKTLEEPPEWAVFVLCTTEAHKIPTTIASRCQQFSFRSVDFAEVVGRMEWILKQEGIAADTETLSVLAQAGEGSVRDSLSALDQAIACCGDTLNAADVRSLLGMFSLDSLAQVSQALLEQDSRRMLDVVMELERNGRNLQHFCRELARYFRNLLVVKVAGPNTRLIAATEQEQERLAGIAASFSEEDLTRYLQITLDVFKDLQSSLQPRLHVEIGLLKLVQAGKLTTIEEALAGLGGGPGARGQETGGGRQGTGARRQETGARRQEPGAGRQGTGARSQETGGGRQGTGAGRQETGAGSQGVEESGSRESGSRGVGESSGKAGQSRRETGGGGQEAEDGRQEAGDRSQSRGNQGVEDSRSQPAPAPKQGAPAGDLLERLHVAATELGMAFTADALEHSQVIDKGGELQFITTAEFKLAMDPKELQKAVQQVMGRALKVTVTVGEPEVGAAREIRRTPANEDEAAARALSHPEVLRFREAFPEAQVRAVRNLKE